MSNLDDTIQTLKDYKNKLQVLNMEGNPFILSGNQTDAGYKYQAVFRLKSLKYLDYILIDKALRDEAEETCKDQYQEINDQNA